MKVIVFDFDETLGHFGQLGDFVEALERWLHKPIKREVLYRLIELFPLVLRQDLKYVLKLIKDLKEQRYVNKVMIYTNNMAPRAWVLAVKRYLELKLGFSQGAGFFNRVISAYKVGGKQIEKKRTSHAKTYSDLLSSGNLSPNTQVLFFDDQNHPIMGHKNVKYVKVPRYTYIYNIRHMLAVFLHCPLLSSLIRDRRKFVNFMYGELKNYDINSHLVHHIPKNEGNELIKIIKNFANV